MLKLRLMGTKRDIDWFRDVLVKIPDVKVNEFSDFYSNKGTNRFYRVYIEVDRVRELNINNTEEER